MSSGKWWPFCLGLNVLRLQPHLPGANELNTCKATDLVGACQLIFENSIWSAELFSNTLTFNMPAAGLLPLDARTFALALLTMEIFLDYWLFVKGICLSLVYSPHKGMIMQSFAIFLIINMQAVEQTVELSVIWDAFILMWWVPGDLRSHDAHVTSL